jgi:hypothetical protein
MLYAICYILYASTPSSNLWFYVYIYIRHMQAHFFQFSKYYITQSTVHSPHSAVHSTQIAFGRLLVENMYTGMHGGTEGYIGSEESRHA